MTSRAKKKARAGKQAGRTTSTINVREVSSLLDEMQDGNEYGSIVSLVPREMDIATELRRALVEIQAIRQRPCLCYVANLVKRVPYVSIDAADHLPFNEMVDKVKAGTNAVDVFLVTPGGSGEQVHLFVEALRNRFDDVQFLIPYRAMSAGTMWALSGNGIWMDSRAFLGPIDPQVQTANGQTVPAQALLVLLRKIQEEGQEKLARNQQPDWTHLQLLRSMDQRQLGAAMSGSEYSINLVKTYLTKYKFRGWDTHASTGVAVTPEERLTRATQVATQLCDHSRWKAHGHAISRAVAQDDLRIRIDRPEDVPGLQRAIRRAWALWYYMFDRIPVVKGILSEDYAFFRMGQELPPNA